MDVIRKDATITNTDEEFPGSFEVVLSDPSKDRDGENLASEDWKTPLPEHITFDADHGMSVASTVGSGTPRLEESGDLIVSGTYSSLPRAQEVRTLVKEGHIRTTSVAFMSEKVPLKGGKTRVVRELLNGAFVAIPSNRNARVLSSKAGARNSKTDAANIQAIHDAAGALGAMCAGPMDDTGAEDGATGGKDAAPTDQSAPPVTTKTPDDTAESAAADNPAADDAAGKSAAADEPEPVVAFTLKTLLAEANAYSE